MKRRSSFRNYAEYGLVRSLFFLLRVLPDALSLSIAQAIAQVVRLSLPRLSKVARRNLQLALPSLPPQDHAQIIRGVFDSVGRLLWVVAKISSNTSKNLHKYLQIDNLEVVTNAYREEHGVLFATGHLGAWELSAIGFADQVRAMDVMARPLDNPLLDAWVRSIRSATGNRILSKSGMLREVLRALSENRAVGFLVDHNVISSDLCFIRFFGIETAASTVFAKLAAKTGAVVVPGYALWEEGKRRFVLRFYDPVPMTGNAETDTQQIHSRLEAVIRQYPDQWLWIHRRFKTRPDGSPPLYENL